MTRYIPPGLTGGDVRKIHQSIVAGVGVSLTESNNTLTINSSTSAGVLALSANNLGTGEVLVTNNSALTFDIKSISGGGDVIVSTVANSIVVSANTGLSQSSADSIYVAIGSLSALSQFNNDSGFITEASADVLYLSANTPLGGGFTEASADARYLRLSTDTSAQVVSALSLQVQTPTFNVVGAGAGAGNISLQTDGGQTYLQLIGNAKQAALFGREIFLGTFDYSGSQLHLGSTPGGAHETVFLGSDFATTTFLYVQNQRWPTSPGTNGQVLTTNGAFNLDWSTPTVYLTEASADAAYQAIGTEPVITPLEVSAVAFNVSAGQHGQTVFVDGSATATIVSGFTPGHYINFYTLTSAPFIITPGSGQSIIGYVSSATVETPNKAFTLLARTGSTFIVTV